MAIPTWGMLEKSQTDQEKIEQAIARLISEHNDDETAHLGSGQSLQSHKASEIIDHVVNSVVADKIATGQIVINHLSEARMFERIDLKSLDISNAGPNSFTKSMYAEISTGVTQDVFYEAVVGGDEYALRIGAGSTSPIFRVRAVIPNTTSQVLYFGIGSFVDSSVGFKIVNGDLYAVFWTDELTEMTYFISDIDLTIPHNYECVVDYQNSIKWYIDGVYKKFVAWSWNPVIEGGNDGMTFQVKKTSAADRIIILYQIFYEQDYF